MTPCASSAFQKTFSSRSLLLELLKNLSSVTIRRYEADHVGMVMMACSGYDPSRAVSLWREFDAIAQRQKLTAEFFRPIVQEICGRRDKFDPSNYQDPLAMAILSMVKDKQLEFLDRREKRTHMAVLPGYVSSFPLEPTIHPYDGVFTGRITVGKKSHGS